MKIFPAIDLRDKKAVRLLRGDYGKMTVYNDNPPMVAKGFEEAGAEFLHVVDLDGAKDGNNPNFEVVEEIVKTTSLKVEIGGGIRDEEIIKKYLDAGVMRVILGTIAIKNPDFTSKMIKKYGERIAIGADISNGKTATHGWTELSDISPDEFFTQLEAWGASTVICTDISKDGAMEGTNLELYRYLSDKYGIDIIASGGVSSISDVKALRDMDIYGAILGKALYTGAIDLREAIEVTK